MYLSISLLSFYQSFIYLPLYLTNIYYLSIQYQLLIFLSTYLSLYYLLSIYCPCSYVSAQRDTQSDTAESSLSTISINFCNSAEGWGTHVFPTRWVRRLRLWVMPYCA